MNRVFIVLFSLIVFALAAFAQGEGKTPEDMQKMMAEWQKWSTPGPEHQLLGKMVGEWTCTGKSWMGPDQPPMEGTPGTAKSEFVFGGRFLKSDYSGDIMGMPFQGVGYLGYDNFRQQYWMTWFDNMTTALFTAYGAASADGTELTLMGKSDDPMTGEKDKDTKYYYKFVDENTMIFEVWDMTQGKTYKGMEMTYTKK
ncbi:DUF1579 domain-containing protein [bacterium]|nr:DUF1579 domain-containing protein [bacterium]MBU1983774.1 DUF1579 domain-containing protein [bacterium]